MSTIEGEGLMKKIAATPPPARVRKPPEATTVSPRDDTVAILPDRETRAALRKQRRSRSGKVTARGALMAKVIAFLLLVLLASPAAAVPNLSPVGFVCPADYRCQYNALGWSVYVESSIAITPGTGTLGLGPTDSPAAVPEPATWLLMVVDLTTCMLLLGLLRRRS